MESNSKLSNNDFINRIDGLSTEGGSDNILSYKTLENGVSLSSDDITNGHVGGITASKLSEIFNNLLKWQLNIL